MVCRVPAGIAPCLLGFIAQLDACYTLDAGAELRPGSNLLRPHPGLPRLCALQAALGGRPHSPHEAAEEAPQGTPAFRHAALFQCLGSVFSPQSSGRGP